MDIEGIVNQEGRNLKSTHRRPKTTHGVDFLRKRGDGEKEEHTAPKEPVKTDEMAEDTKSAHQYAVTLRRDPSGRAKNVLGFRNNSQKFNIVTNKIPDVWKPLG